jgi:hypothetical protein
MGTRKKRSDSSSDPDQKLYGRNWFRAQENISDFRILVISLGMAFIFGAFWVGLIAAWEHHDEPNHLQYIRVLLDSGRRPQPGDEDFKLNRQILKSMIWNGFFERFGFEPVLPAPRQPTYLPGYSQYTEPPLYYYLASIGVYVLRSENITRQMFGARLVSFALYLLSIIAAWGLVRDITSEGSALRWMVPISMTFLPGFVDIMTAVNNDAGAVAVMSFFLWANARLVRRGFTWFEFLWALCLAALGVFMKSTAIVSVFLLPFVFLFSLLRGKWQWLVWAVSGAGLIIALFFLFDRQDAAMYYRSSSMEEPIRVQHPQAILGEHVLQIKQNAQSTPRWMPPVFQPIPLDITSEHLGQIVTFGVWMWADKDITAQTPMLVTETDNYASTIQLTTSPLFYTVKGTRNDKIPRLWISFDLAKQSSEDATIFYDGMVLAEGERPLEQPPLYDDLDAKSGTWGENRYQNLLRNGSLETPGLRVMPVIDQLATRFIPDQIRPSFVLTSVFDLRGAGYYYSLALRRIFETFWGYFGWAHIPLFSPMLYSLTLVASIIGIVGAVIALIRGWQDAPWNIIFIFGLAILITGVAAIVRGVIYLSFQNMFFPVARYLMPVVIPVLLVICTGWLETSRIVHMFMDRITKKQFREEVERFSWIPFLLFIAGWLVFAVLAAYSVIRHYGGYPLFF